MKPLVFLTVRTTINGIRRALTSPQRLIGLLFFFSWYAFYLFSPGGRRTKDLAFPDGVAGSLDFPAFAAIDSVVFGVFAVFSLFLAISAFGPRQGFRPADVDVLFATPVSNRVVLVFRIVREYLVTLILPLLIGLLTLRPMAMGWEALFRNVRLPESAGLTGRMMFIAWVAMALVWVAISYATSLFVNRSDFQSDRNKRWIVGGLGALIVATGGYVGWRLTGAGNVGAAIDIAQTPYLRVVFFSASFATELVMAPLTGNVAQGALGLLGMVLVIFSALHVAMSQVGWMYDQAAVRVHEAYAARSRQVQGDLMGSMVVAARAGKVRAGRKSWLHRVRWQGPLALVWKDALMQMRGTRLMLSVFALLGIAMSAFPALIPARGDSEMALGGLVAVMQAVVLVMISLGVAQTGFIEVLRRVDLQKPLPFPPGTTVLMEIAAKALPGVATIWLGGAAAVAIRPTLWPVVVGTAILAIPTSLFITGVVLLMTVLFPDVEDPTQRSFRNLMIMLGVILGGAWAGGLFAGLWVFGAPPWLAAFPAAALNLALAFGVAMVAGRLYASYNPSE